MAIESLKLSGLLKGTCDFILSTAKDKKWQVLRNSVKNPAVFPYFKIWNKRQCRKRKTPTKKNPRRFLLQGEGETKYVCAVDWSSRDKRSNLIHREISASEGQKPKVVCCFCWHKRQWQKLKCWVLYNGIQICWFTSHSLNVYLCPVFLVNSPHAKCKLISNLSKASSNIFFITRAFSKM